MKGEESSSFAVTIYTRWWEKGVYNAVFSQGFSISVQQISKSCSWKAPMYQFWLGSLVRKEGGGCVWIHQLLILRFETTLPPSSVVMECLVVFRDLPLSLAVFTLLYQTLIIWHIKWMCLFFILLKEFKYTHVCLHFKTPCILEGLCGNWSGR